MPVWLNRSKATFFDPHAAPYTGIAQGGQGGLEQTTTSGFF